MVPRIRLPLLARRSSPSARSRARRARPPRSRAGRTCASPRACGSRTSSSAPFVKDGELRLDLLLVGRATGATAGSSCPRRRAAGRSRCRVESSRAVRFRRRPQTLVGWHPTFRGAVGISGLRIRVAARGGARRHGRPRTSSWRRRPGRSRARTRRCSSARTRPCRSTRVHIVVTPVAGGGAAVIRLVHGPQHAGRSTCARRSAAARRSAGVRCRTSRGPARSRQGRRVTVPIAATLGPIAGAERVRFRADGGVFPSPFVQMILPWPPA